MPLQIGNDPFLIKADLSMAENIYRWGSKGFLIGKYEQFFYRITSVKIFINFTNQVVLSKYSHKHRRFGVSLHTEQ